IWSLAQAEDGTVWIGTSAGLHSWREDRGLSPVIELVSDADSLSRKNEIRALAVWQHELWVGSRQGLFRYAAEKQRFITQPLAQAEPTVNVLYVDDHEHQLLIGSYNGLHRLTPGAADASDTEQHLPPVNVRSIIRDRSGVLWLGSRESGLYRNVVSRRGFSGLSHIDEW